MSFDDVRPGDALRALPPDVPVTLIGGGDDRRVPPDDVQRLFEELPTEAALKELWIHPTAVHGKVWIEDPDGYRQRVAALLERVLR